MISIDRGAQTGAEEFNAGCCDSIIMTKGLAHGFAIIVPRARVVIKIRSWVG